MTRRERPDLSFVEALETRMSTIMQLKQHLSAEDIVYVQDRLAKLKDDRLKQLFQIAIGWSEDDRMELEYFIALSLHVLNKTNPSKIREAARVISLRMYIHGEGETK